MRAKGKSDCTDPPELAHHRTPQLTNAATPRQFVSELVLLGLQIPPGEIRGGNLEWNRFGDRQPIALQADELSRIVRQEAHRLDPQVARICAPMP